MSLDTRGIDPQRLLPQSLEDRLLGWFARAGGACLLAIVGVVWLSLVTWSMSDPSLTHATASQARNWAGPLGAVVSDLLLQTLGFAAVFTLIVPIVWTRELVRERRIAVARTKIGFYPLAVLGAAGALSSYATPGFWPLHHGLGGVLGDGLFKLTERVFALINEDRAGLAASLVLNAAALSAFAKSIGLDLETATQTWMSSAATKSPAETADAIAASAGRLKPAAASARRWWPLPRKAKPIAESLYGAGAELAIPEPFPPPHQWSRDERYPHLSSYAGAPAGLTAATRMPQEADAIDPEVRPAFGNFDFGVTQERDGIAPVRELSFDASTDAASRVIAARFAPGAQEAALPVAQVKPAAAGMTASLLGGLSFRKSDPEWKRPSLNLLKRAPAAKPSPEFTQTSNTYYKISL